MAQFFDIDVAHPFQEQLDAQVGPIVLTNTFTIPEGQMDAAIQVWRQTALYAKVCPGYLSTQLHRGVANSNVLINYAIWESAQELRDCLHSEEFKVIVREFPAGTECRAQVSQKIRIDGACAGNVAS
jgi:heme-degrading monooxygenase HmoA